MVSVLPDSQVTLSAMSHADFMAYITEKPTPKMARKIQREVIYDITESLEFAYENGLQHLPYTFRDVDNMPEFFLDALTSA